MTGGIRIIELSLVFTAALTGMEGVAWIMHRYMMHGALWFLHRDHHAKRGPGLELNDLFAVFFASPAIICLYLGIRGHPVLLAAGLGVTAYGMIYFLFHDGLVHRRFPGPMSQGNRFWKPRVQAHHLHHTVATKHGCVSFGFLWAPPVRQVRQQLVLRQRQGRQ
jgi:beta-carotene 3-hydroxylase